MLQSQSKLKIADNTGVKFIKIIGISVGFGLQKSASIGDVVIGSVQKTQSDSTIKNHEKVYAVIIRTKKEIKRMGGSHIRFDDNAGVILEGVKSKNIKGTRIFGPVARELKEHGYNKIISLAQEVL